jgi:opacity protein-like surface antigen
MRLAPALLLSLLAVARAAAAQESGATVGASTSATNMDSRTELAFSGAFGYRFSRTIGLELEAAWVPTLSSPFPPAGGNPVLIQSTSASSFVVFPGPFYTNPSGRLVIVSNSVRVEIPTTAPALTPYFVAGGGIANIRRSADFTFPIPSPLAAIPVPIRITTERVSSSATYLALTLGGGLAVRVSSHVSVDGDLRFFRLLGDQDRNVGRFGAGVRYRF